MDTQKRRDIQILAEDFQVADIETKRDACFRLLKVKISGAKRGCHSYWESVGYMQELANDGYSPARKYMLGIDTSKAQSSVGYRSNLARLESGTPSVSFRGVRRQLLTDPNSPNRTYISSGSIEV